MVVKLARDSIDLGIVTANEDAMIGFYHGVLGLPLIGSVTLPDGARIHRIGCGQSTLRLYIPAATPRPAGDAQWSAVTGLRYCAILIDNLATVIDECARAGTRIVQDIVEPRPGVRAALIADPDGNIIELMQIGDGGE